MGPIIPLIQLALTSRLHSGVTMGVKERTLQNQRG